MDPNTETRSAQRFVFLDALRGFDMFWIVGGDAAIASLARMLDFQPFRFLGVQMQHVAWAGFRFYDLIFPLFVFIVGVSIVFSLSRELRDGGRSAALKRVARRFLILFFLALIYSGGASRGWPDIRLMVVLNRIALCYFVASILFLFFRPRTLIAICVFLLLGYWTLMTFVPIRNIQLQATSLARTASEMGDEKLAEQILSGGNPSRVKNSPIMSFAQDQFEATSSYVAGSYAPGLNLANHIDFNYLPGMKYDQYWDPEGLLSTLPAIVTALLGVLTGICFLSDLTALRKIQLIVFTGIACAMIGWIWHFQFPVVKKIWTSSFVLVAGGYSMLLFAFFFYIIELRGWKQWSAPFVWIGRNAITIYVAGNLLGGFSKVAARFVGGDIEAFAETHVATHAGGLLQSLVAIGLVLTLSRFLYARKIFLRI